MTVATTGDGNLPATYDPDLAATGLEDISASDVIVPRLRINHTEGVFVDNLSNAEFPKLRVILLGLVKQRIMWADDVDEGDTPLCKSPDFEHGFPNLNLEIPKDKRFPVAKSNFDLNLFPAEKGLNGHVTLPCDSCVFQKWDQGDWKKPPCSEQHTYPLLYSASGDGDPDNWVPALLTVQKSGIRPSRQYISSFAQTKTAMFTTQTEISLDLQNRGTVTYSVPKFKNLRVPTDRDEWPEYADQLRSLRSFVRMPPRPAEDDAEEYVEETNENVPPATAAAEKKQARPAAAAARPKPVVTKEEPVVVATVMDDDDDDLPF